MGQGTKYTISGHIIVVELAGESGSGIKRYRCYVRRKDQKPCEAVVIYAYATTRGQAIRNALVQFQSSK